MQSWIRPKMRVADHQSDINKRKQDLKNQGKTPSGVPNPDTPTGREDMIEKLQIRVGDVELRARLMKKLITEALKADNRQDFKAQLILMTDQVTQLKMYDVPGVVDTLLATIKLYEKSQGRDLNLKEFRDSDPADDTEKGASSKTASVDWLAYIIR